MRATIIALQWLSAIAATAPPPSMEEILSQFNEIYGRGATTKTTRPTADDESVLQAIGPKWPAPTDGPPATERPATAAIARSRLPNNEPCESVEGLWLSSSLEVVFEVRATATAGRLFVEVVGSGWTGGAESLFGGGGPVTAYVSSPDAGDAATFVGHCRVVDRVDSITGVWVIASTDKNKLDHHLAVQPIPDTLHRLNFG